MTTLAQMVADRTPEQGKLKKYKWVEHKTGQQCWNCGKETLLTYPTAGKQWFFRCEPCEVEWRARVK
jgi:ssDNA-binding Zn-finger/Zn-ribbon topoisomerase 1